MANQANMSKGVIDRVNLPAVAWADANVVMRYTMQHLVPPCMERNRHDPRYVLADRQ
jgi:hypothetical protein